MASCKIVLLICLMFCLIEFGAPRWWGRRHRGRRHREHECLFGPGPDEDCHYSTTPKYSECDEKTQTYTKSYLLENGPEGCDLGYVTVQHCKKNRESEPCNYKTDRNERWSHCDRSTNTKTRRMLLDSGGSHCPVYSYKTKPCRKPHHFVYDDYLM